MALTPERRAELRAIIDGPPKPKVVVSDSRTGRPEVIRDVDVPVHPRDRNSRGGTVEVVHVRRPEHVTINFELAEAQWANRRRDEAMEAASRQALREADDMGVWSRNDD